MMSFFVWLAAEPHRSRLCYRHEVYLCFKSHAVFLAAVSQFLFITSKLSIPYIVLVVDTAYCPWHEFLAR